MKIKFKQPEELFDQYQQFVKKNDLGDQQEVKQTREKIEANKSDDNLKIILGKLAEENLSFYDRFKKDLVASKKDRRDRLNNFLEKNGKNRESDIERKKLLENITCQYGELSPEIGERMKQDFPSGNWLLHATTAESALKIINSGKLVSNYELINQTSNNGDEEDYKPGAGGFFGISFNFNKVSVLPGSPADYVSFCVSPETILANGNQMGVGFESTSDELQAYPEKIDIKELNKQQESFMFHKLYTFDAIFCGLDFDTGNEIKPTVAEFFKVVMKLKRDDFMRGDDSSKFFSFEFFGDARRGMLSGISKIFTNKESHIDEEARTFLKKKVENIFFNNNGLLEKIKENKDLSENEIVDSVWCITQDLQECIGGYLKMIEQVNGEFSNLNMSNAWIFCSSADVKYIQEICSLTNKIPRGIIVYPLADGPRISSSEKLTADPEKLDQIVKETMVSAGVDESAKINWSGFFDKPLAEVMTNFENLGVILDIVRRGEWENAKKMIMDSDGNLKLVN